VSLLWVALLCTTTAAGGVLSLINHQSEYALVSIAIVLVVMIGCKIFGLAEFQLISRRANSLARSFFHVSSSNVPEVLQSSVHVQGSRDWQDVWKVMCDFADEHRLSQLAMDINAPWLHESFHATLKRADVRRGENREWFSVIPLISEGRVFGRVEIYGVHDPKISHHEVIENILKVTSDIEQLMVETAPAVPVSANPATPSTPAGTSA
jgi:UDP-GlcNAc:undecaprenyl-phosphate GlcNAc-1-phosphate transferase